jgi:hypothetical protein
VEIEVDNVVAYSDDLADTSKMATSPAVAPWPFGLGRTFKFTVALGDIVTINGKPAKGTLVTRQLMIMFTPNYTPGRAMADFAGGGFTDVNLVIMQPDGTMAGTITSTGICGMTPPPGASTKGTGGTSPSPVGRAPSSARGDSIPPQR